MPPCGLVPIGESDAQGSIAPLLQNPGRKDEGTLDVRDPVSGDSTLIRGDGSIEMDDALN